VWYLVPGVCVQISRSCSRSIWYRPEDLNAAWSQPAGTVRERPRRSVWTGHSRLPASPLVETTTQGQYFKKELEKAGNRLVNR
jgi:hypothetical protein